MNGDLTITTDVHITGTLTLTENQLRALEALAGYGDDAFFKAFYLKLGKAYMQPVERDLRELFALIRKDVPVALSSIRQVRESLNIPASSGKWVKKVGRV